MLDHRPQPINSERSGETRRQHMIIKKHITHIFNMHMEGQWSNSGAMATMVPLGKNQFKNTSLWHSIDCVSTSSYVGGVDN